MAPVFVLLAILFQMQGIMGDSFTLHPKPKKFCDTDVFIPSTPYNGKAFLIPGDVKLRQSDWYGSRSFCAQHCAEAVTLHSQAESNFFIKFTNVNGETQTWIGANVVNSVVTWSNGEVVDYTNPISAADFRTTTEPTFNCIHTYTVNSKWYASTRCDNANFYIACQRPATWVPGCE